MSEAILLLRLEHRHADDLLRLIERQYGEQDLRLDLSLLRDICDYFSDYPDQCHHPVEDRVFRKLQARDPEAGARVGPLLEEHENISELSIGFARALDKATRGSKDDEAQLRKTLKNFVERYRAHMYGEEQLFFPLALETLTDHDWSEIEFDLFDRPDPLFDRAEEERFRKLRERIEGDAELSWQRAGFLRRARRLHTLTDVESFNDLMDDASTGYQLIEHANGGYGLKKQGDVVIDIPKCSQVRAVWCAYYFLEPGMWQELSAG